LKIENVFKRKTTLALNDTTTLFTLVYTYYVFKSWFSRSKWWCTYVEIHPFFSKTL